MNVHVVHDGVVVVILGRKVMNVVALSQIPPILVS
jgi:hypothetical protein